MCAASEPSRGAPPPADLARLPVGSGTGTLAGVLALGLGPPELLIVLIIVLVLFGGAKLPKLARSLGQAQREFREGVNEEDNAAGDKASGNSSSSDS